MHRKNPNRKFSLRFGKEETSTEDKRRRLRRLVPSGSFLTRLRRPYLFPCAGKDRGEKGAWTRLVLPASDFRREAMFQSGVPLGSHLTSFCCAPPDTGESDLQLVALERLLSIEGADEIRIDVTFLRGKAPLAGADSPYQGEMSQRDKRGRDAVSRRLTERLYQICIEKPKPQIQFAVWKGRNEHRG